MQEVKISLETIERVKKFVGITTQYEENFDLVYGRYIIDGKSLLGIFSIDLSRPVLLRIYAEGEHLQKIIEDIQDYIVK